MQSADAHSKLGTSWHVPRPSLATNDSMVDEVAVPASAPLVGVHFNVRAGGMGVHSCGFGGVAQK